MVKTTTAGILAFVSAWGLTACGGGGGSSSSNVDDTPTERPSSADISVDPNGHAERQISIDVQDDTDAILVLYEDAENAYLLAEEMETAVTSSSPTSSGNELTYDCKNGGEVVITVNSDEENDDERWRFDNCDLNTPTFGRIVLNGGYDYVNKVIRNDEGENIGDEGFQVFDITGSVVATEEGIVAKGLDEWKVVENGDERTETYQTDALEFIIGDDYFAIANALTTIQSDNSGVNISLTSKLVGSNIGGYIEISTLEDVFVASGESCPQSGTVRLDGENDSFAEIRYLDDTGTGDVAEITFGGSSDVVTYDNCESLIF